MIGRALGWLLGRLGALHLRVDLAALYTYVFFDLVADGGLGLGILDADDGRDVCASWCRACMRDILDRLDVDGWVGTNVRHGVLDTGDVHFVLHTRSGGPAGHGVLGAYVLHSVLRTVGPAGHDVLVAYDLHGVLRTPP